MRMLLVGAGAVGESILKVLKKRDPKGEWLEFVLVGDCRPERARKVAAGLRDAAGAGDASGQRDGAEQGDAAEAGDAGRFVPVQVDAFDREGMVKLIRDNAIDFVMDAADPYVSNYIFDAAFAAGARYGNMGTWSVPKENPAFGLGIENSYDEPMTKYNFDRHEAWREAGNMACICLGIDPGAVNVFARYAAEELFDLLEEVHVKDGGSLSMPQAEEGKIWFGFNVWTVLDEVMNPNVEYDEEKGGLWVEKPFAGAEDFLMPEGIGLNHLVKVEHEEVVTLPRYLKAFGLKRATFKIALEENLINALRVIDALGLRSLKPVHVDGVDVVPRDVVAAVAAQPADIGEELAGAMCVGIHCIGRKDGERREVFIYQRFDNERSMKEWGTQAVVMQTGFAAALGIECIGRGFWKDAGVFSPEYFDPHPYMRLAEESGFGWNMAELAQG